jgi:hypothetical protein
MEIFTLITYAKLLKNENLTFFDFHHQFNFIWESVLASINFKLLSIIVIFNNIKYLSLKK